MVFNGTYNYKLSHSHNILNFISTRQWVTIEMPSNGPPMCLSKLRSWSIMTPISFSCSMLCSGASSFLNNI